MEKTAAVGAKEAATEAEEAAAARAVDGAATVDGMATHLETRVEAAEEAAAAEAAAAATAARWAEETVAGSALEEKREGSGRSGAGKLRRQIGSSAPRCTYPWPRE